MNSKNLSLIEASEQLGIEAATLRQQIARGKLKAVKRGRDWWVTQAEVDRYRGASLGRQKPRSAPETAPEPTPAPVLTQSAAARRRRSKAAPARARARAEKLTLWEGRS